MDCLRREPLDLAEDSVCEDAWLGEGVPDWGHLSAAQSTSTHTGNTKPHTSVTFMFKIMTLSCTQFMQVHILPWAVSLMIIQERGPSLCAAPGHWTHTVHKFRVSHRIMWFSQNWHTVPKKDQAAEKSQSNLKKKTKTNVRISKWAFSPANMSAWRENQAQVYVADTEPL